MNSAVSLIICVCLFSVSNVALSMAGLSKKRVAIVGSGNWGSAIARTVAKNVVEMDDYEDEVKMWTFEELVDGRNLSEIINSENENVKYLPGIKLPKSVVAVPDLVDSCNDADVLVFVVPHQFLPRVLDTMKDNIKSDAVGISLIKGLNIDENGPNLLSTMIQKKLGLSSVAVLMGANVAADVVKDDFVEATLGCPDIDVGNGLKPIFDCPTFRITCISDVPTVEICGAVKNVIAMGGGFCDGMGLGTSTKAAVLRRGLVEMCELCKKLSSSFNYATVLESCGVADVIATSFGGRNRKCAAEYARLRCEGLPASWETIETEILGGQKMQGLGTLDEVIQWIDTLGCQSDFPLIYNIYGISRKDAALDSLFNF